jgi:HSP20 family protein
MRNRQIAVFNPARMMEDPFFEGFFPRTMDYHPNELEMYEDDNDVVVRIKAPGFNEEDMDISVEDNMLSISGNVKSETEENDTKKKYYYREIRSESFSRSVSLPTRVKSDEAKAEMINGILEIRMPKAEEVKPKRIQIQANTKK